MIFPAPTPRLVLRAWREEDLGTFTAMNADPRVMEYFPAPLTPEQITYGSRKKVWWRCWAVDLIPV